MAKATKQASSKASIGTQASTAHGPMPNASASQQVGPSKHSLQQPTAPAQLTAALSQLPSRRVALKGTSWQAKPAKDHSEIGPGGTRTFVKAANQPS